MKALEERLVTKMSDSIAGIQKEFDSKLRCIEAVQGNLIDKTNTLSEEAFASRTDMLAGEEELNRRLYELTQECLSMREDTLAGEDLMTARSDKLESALQV